MKTVRTTGVTSRGIRLPIIKEGDPLAKIIVESIDAAVENEGFELHDRDVIAITESVVARNDGNYATVNDIAASVKELFGEHADIGLIFPILSRNRFAILLKGIARGVRRMTLMLSYPSDEVGNKLFDDSKYPYEHFNTLLTLQQFRDKFGYCKHQFTGVDYIEYYKELIESQGCECQIIFSNNPADIGDYAYNVLCADIHTRARTKKQLKAFGLNVFGLDDVLTHPRHEGGVSGFNSKYGLLGSNKATENTVKLFPEYGNKLIKDVQLLIQKKYGVHVEVMVYGDGAFKDPQGKIWELADPVVSPFYTSGLEGTPNEVKIKFLADNKYSDLYDAELTEAIKEEIRKKDTNLVGNMVSEGTTPRKITDLLGSLADLTSGSGDKGTPVVLIQGYFDNFSND